MTHANIPDRILDLLLIMDKFLKRYKNLLFVDVETTGLDPINDRIIEIGIVKVDKDNNKSTFSKLVNPGYKISKEVRQLTGIKLKDLAEAPLFEDLLYDLLDYFKADLFIAHNAKFDFDFISEELIRHDQELLLSYVDTIKLAKHFYPNYLTYSLDSIIARLKLTVGKRHRGLDDAEVLWQLYHKLILDFGEEHVQNAISKFVITPKRRRSGDKTQVSLF